MPPRANLPTRVGLSFQLGKFSPLHTVDLPEYNYVMQVKDEDVAKFIAIYKAEFGEQLSIPDARSMALNLLELYRLLLSPTPSEREAAQQEAEPDQVTSSS